MIYVVLEGEIHPSSEPTASSGPCIWAIGEDDIEGAVGRRSTTLRTWGEPFVSVTQHFRAARFAFSFQPGDPPLRLAPHPEVLAAARAYVDGVSSGPSAEARAYAFTRSLVDAGWVIDADMAASTRERSPLVDRVWSALSHFYGALELSPSMIQLADIAELSPRHVDRVLRQFVDSYGVPGGGWRDFTRRWRLKLAVLLLSSESAAVADVAKLVGYRNPGALANALAAEGLPAPTRYSELFARRASTDRADV